MDPYEATITIPLVYQRRTVFAELKTLTQKVSDYLVDEGFVIALTILNVTTGGERDDGTLMVMVLPLLEQVVEVVVGHYYKVKRKNYERT